MNFIDGYLTIIICLGVFIFLFTQFLFDFLKQNRLVMILGLPQKLVAMQVYNPLYRAVGLLNHSCLGPGTGLLLMHTRIAHCRGMAFAIDILFLDKKGRVLKVYQNVSRNRVAWCLQWNCAMTLEVPAGTWQGEKGRERETHLKVTRFEGTQAE